MQKYLVLTLVSFCAYAMESPQAHSVEAEDVATTIIRDCSLEENKCLALPGGIPLEIRRIIAELKEQSIATPRRRELSPTTHGLYLKGGPGMGKSTLAHFMASQTKRVLITLRCETLITAAMETVEKEMRSIFHKARIPGKGIVIFLHRLDLLFREGLGARIGELVQELIRGNSHVFLVISAYNEAPVPNALTTVCKSYAVQLPDDQECLSIFNHCFGALENGGLKSDLPEFFFNKFVTELIPNTLSRRDCKEIILTAACYARERNKQSPCLYPSHLFRALYLKKKEQLEPNERQKLLGCYMQERSKQKEFSASLPAECKIVPLPRELCMFELSSHEVETLRKAKRGSTTSVARRILTEALEKQDIILRAYANKMNGWSVERIETFIQCAVAYSAPKIITKIAFEQALRMIVENAPIAQQLAFSLVTQELSRDGYEFDEKDADSIPLQGLSVEALSQCAREAQSWAHKRNSRKVIAGDLHCVLYKLYGDRLGYLRRPTILYLLKYHYQNRCSTKAIELVVEYTYRFSVDQLVAILDDAQQESRREHSKEQLGITDTTVLAHCHLALEKTNKGWSMKTIKDHPQFIHAIILHYLNKHKNAVPDKFVARIVKAIRDDSIIVTGADIEGFMREAKLLARTRTNDAHAAITQEDLEEASKQTSCRVPALKDEVCSVQ